MLPFNSSIDALVSSVEAAFFSEMDDRFSSTSVTLFFALSHVAALSLTTSIFSLVSLIRFETSSNLCLVSSNLLFCSLVCSESTSIVFTISPEAASSVSIISSMVTVEFWDSSANCLISSATTANPLPDSPARAASMLAFRLRRLVCEAICVINCVDSCILCTKVFVFSICSATL